jgi:hypothetical protein
MNKLYDVKSEFYGITVKHWSEMSKQNFLSVNFFLFEV